MFSKREIDLWKKDEVLISLFKNASILFSGNVMASVIGIGSLAITARALGPEKLGILVLVQTYVLIVDRLINFQSWQALIKHGSELLIKNDMDSFRKLIKFGTVIDACTVISGTLIAVSVVHWVGEWLNWTDETSKMAGIYSLVILTHMSGTPTAVLRLFNRFKLFSLQSIVASAVKLIFVCFAYLRGADLIGFILIWAITDAFGNIFLFVSSWRILHENRIKNVFKARIRDIRNTCPGIIMFIFSTNFETSVRVISREADNFIVSILMSVDAVGLYKIIKQISKILSKVADPLYQVAYPIVTKMNAEKKYDLIREYLRKTVLLGLLFVLLVVVLYLLVGKAFIVKIFGSQYISIYWPTLIGIIGVSVWVVMFSYSSTAYAMGYADKVALLSLFGAISSLLLQIWLIKYLYLSGAIIGYISAFVIWGMGIFIIVSRTMKQKRRNRVEES